MTADNVAHNNHVAEKYLRKVLGCSEPPAPKHAVLARHVDKHDKAPKFFVAFQQKTRKPIFAHDAKLARRFDPSDKMMLNAFIHHITTEHGHKMFVVIGEE